MARPSGDHWRSTSLRSLKALRVSAPWRRTSAAARRRSSPSASRLGRSGAKISAAATDRGRPRAARARAATTRTAPRCVHGGGIQREEREGTGRGGVGRDGRGQSRPGREHGREREREGTAQHGAGARERARKAGHAVADGEGRSGAPQHDGQRPADDRLLDVEALEHVQDAEKAEQGDRGGHGPAAAARELPGGAEQGEPRGERQRMREGDLVHGGDGQQRAQPQRDRGRERGGDVDHPDERGRACCEHRHALVHRCGRQVRRAVQPGPPHGRVARGRVQVAPVLDHQPRAGCEQRGERRTAQPGQRERRRRRAGRRCRRGIRGRAGRARTAAGRAHGARDGQRARPLSSAWAHRAVRAAGAVLRPCWDPVSEPRRPAGGRARRAATLT